LKLSIDPVIILAVAILLITLFLVGYISYQSIITFIQTDVFVDRTNLIIQKVRRLAMTLSDEETGQRGYIIPDKPSYLNPYQSSVGYIRSQLDLIAMMPDYSTKQDLKSLTSL
jgi:CHASE3 domain sensor protein